MEPATVAARTMKARGKASLSAVEKSRVLVPMPLPPAIHPLVGLDLHSITMPRYLVSLLDPRRHPATRPQDLAMHRAHPMSGHGAMGVEAGGFRPQVHPHEFLRAMMEDFLALPRNCGIQHVQDSGSGPSSLQLT